MQAWFWVCDLDQFPTLWAVWREKKVASIGWPPPSNHYGKTFSQAMNSVREVRAGDRVVAYLKGGRIGAIGTASGRKSVEDGEYDALLPKDGEQGRRVEVVWAEKPSAGYYVAVPEGLDTPTRGQTLRKMSQSGLDDVEAAVKDHSLWDHLADSAELAPNEKHDLHPQIFEHLPDLEPGLALFDPEVRFEYPARPIGKIDILARDRNGTPVVVEAKRHSVDDAVVGQTLRYMAWVRMHLGSSSVRGIIVAGEFTPFTRYAASMVPSLSLVRYAIRDGRIRFTGGPTLGEGSSRP